MSDFATVPQTCTCSDCEVSDMLTQITNRPKDIIIQPWEKCLAKFLAGKVIERITGYYPEEILENGKEAAHL